MSRTLTTGLRKTSASASSNGQNTSHAPGVVLPEVRRIIESVSRLFNAENTSSSPRVVSTRVTRTIESRSSNVQNTSREFPIKPFHILGIFRVGAMGCK